MASTSSLLSEEHFLCSICMEVFTDPVTTPCGHSYCKACITRYWDTSDVCKCPLCAKIFDRRPDVSVSVFISEMVQQFRSHKLKEEYEAKTEAEIQQMIQERRVKIQEVKRSVEFSRKDAATVIAGSVQVFTSLISCIQRSLIDVIDEKEKTTEKQAEGFIEDLKQEITQLEKRSSELRQLYHLHLLHYRSSRTAPPTKDWTKVNVHQSSYVGTVRTAVSLLEKTLSQEMKNKLCDVEMKRVQQYEVDVSLDPDTAHPCLILSDDGKQVSCGHVRKNLPKKTKRFSYCASVLGEQSISSGRFYYEVEVGGKTDWDIGVARESINRKGQFTPNIGFWTIGLRNENVLLHLEVLQKVGVFVDYEEGLVSFYDVETRENIHSFTGCSFTERLYPYFSPGLDLYGRNSAPLCISPVNHTTN